jgi:hypothetical protein
MLPKQKRLRIFLERLEAHLPARSADEALELLIKILNAVEDEFSDVPSRPENWESDGRLYPPKEDSRVRFPERPSLWKYRSKGHYNFIGHNGSIRIETLDGKTLLDKAGRDGRKTHELDA